MSRYVHWSKKGEKERDDINKLWLVMKLTKFHYSGNAITI